MTGDPHQAICIRCGGALSCNPAGDCWCMAEPLRLPLPPSDAPSDTAGCYCPACFAALAERASAPLTPDSPSR